MNVVVIVLAVLLIVAGAWSAVAKDRAATVWALIGLVLLLVTSHGLSAVS
jgi:hypothetical protein